MNRNTEATLSTIAAFFVLFSAIMDPRISAGLAVVFLIAMSVYLWRSHPAQ